MQLNADDPTRASDHWRAYWLKILRFLAIRANWIGRLAIWSLKNSWLDSFLRTALVMQIAVTVHSIAVAAAGWNCYKNRSVKVEIWALAGVVWQAQIGLADCSVPWVVLG